MNNCIFTTIEKDGIFTHTCNNCGVTRETQTPTLLRKCTKVETQELPKDVISLAKRFVKERFTWVKAGKPYRTPERIEEIFNICSACPNFNKSTEDVGSCDVCGCRLARKDKYLNKIAWATTECPLESPQWTKEQQLSFPTAKEIQEKPTIESPNPEPNQVIQSPREGGCGCGGRK